MGNVVNNILPVDIYLPEISKPAASEKVDAFTLQYTQFKPVNKHQWHYILWKNLLFKKRVEIKKIPRILPYEVLNVYKTECRS